MDRARRMPTSAWITIAAVIVIGGILLAIWLGGGGGDDAGEPAGTPVTVTQAPDVIPPEDQPPATQPAPVNTQTPSAEPAETIAPEQGRRDDEPLVEGGATAP